MYCPFRYPHKGTHTTQKIRRLFLHRRHWYSEQNRLLQSADTHNLKNIMLEKMFPGYFRPSDDELREIWKSALFVFDTNVLLNLYRYSSDTRKELLDVFLKIQEQLWIPHQVAKEVAKNRVEVILEQRDILDNYKKKLSEFNKYVREDFSEGLSKVTNRRQHPIISKDDIIDEIEGIISNHTKELDESSKHLISDITDDHILESIESLIEGRIGPAFTSDEYTSVVTEGEKRFKNKVPPGFRDSKKPGDDKYGDWFIWKQMLTKSSEQKCPIIFITDDGKDDWWWKSYGKTLGAAPELVEEMQKSAHVRVHLYRTERFIHYAQEYLDSKIEDNVIEEVRDVREAAVQQRRYKFITEMNEQSFNALMQLKEMVDQKLISPEQVAEGLNRHLVSQGQPEMGSIRKTELWEQQQFKEQFKEIMQRRIDKKKEEENDIPDEKDSSDEAV